MRLVTRSSAAALAAAAILSACGSGGSTSADPAEAVAQGLSQRLENGFSFQLKLEATETGLASMDMGDNADAVGDLLSSGFISGAIGADGTFALSVGPGDGFAEIRTTEDALYARVDFTELNQLLTSYGEDPIELPPAEQIDGMISMLGLGEEFSATATAAIAGDWFGITGLTEEALAGLSDQLGGMVPTTPDEQSMRDALEEAGLLDGTSIVERYLVVSGEDGTYDVTLKARELLTAVGELASGLSGLATMGGVDTGMPDPADVPEELSGLQVIVADGAATSVRLDLYTIAVAIDPAAADEAGDAGPGDLVAVIELGDVGNRLDVPSGATTLSFTDLSNALMPLLGSLMSGGDFGGGF